MSDPVLCMVVYAVFLAAMAAAHFFKTLDNDLGTAWRTALAIGVAVAFVLFLVRALYPVIGGIAPPPAPPLRGATRRGNQGGGGVVGGRGVWGGGAGALAMVILAHGGGS